MNFNILTDTLTIFVNAFSAGWNNILPAVNYLIGALLAIELVLVGLFYALGGGDKLANVIKKLLYIGFWMWVVTSFPSLCRSFVFSLIQAGSMAGGNTGHSLLDPSRIAGYGLDATIPLVDRLNNIGFNIVDAVIIGWTYILIMIAFLIIAWQVFYAVLEYYLLVAVTGILVPFGFLKPTRFLAEKAIGAIVASGIKLMVLAFILSVAEPVLAGLRFTNADITFNELFSMLLTSGAIAFLAWNAPGVAAGLLAGSPSLSAGTAMQNAFAASMVAGMGSQALVGSIRSAAGAVGTGVNFGTRAIGAVGTASQLGYHSSRMSGAGKMAAVASGAFAGVKAAGGSLVQSTVSKISQNAGRQSRIGGRSGYRASGGTLSAGMQRADAADRGTISSRSGDGQAPGWATSALYHLGSGGRPKPSLSRIKL
jgi:type IV secretion system protein TrbL